MSNNILNQLQVAEQNKSSTPAPAVKNEPYEKKISYLKHKIIFSVCFLGAFAVVMISIIFYNQHVVIRRNDDISLLNSQIENLKSKSANVEARVNDAKKYKQIWIKADGKKRNFSGIKISDINDSFKNLAEKNNIVGPVINISVPEILRDGTYNRQVLDVHLVNCVITFDALTDRIAIDFINSFLNTLPGYVVISDFSIKKIKKEGYTDEELVNISSGKITGLTSVKVNFSWYFLKHKVTNQLTDESKK